MIPEGFQGPLFESEKTDGMHLVSLWHHEELDWVEKDGKHFIPAKTEAFNSFDINTRAEGNIDCIALLPILIHASLQEGTLIIGIDNGIDTDIDVDTGIEIRIWAGNPSYHNE
jgi:hypothetical protein